MSNHGVEGTSCAASNSSEVSGGTCIDTPTTATVTLSSTKASGGTNALKNATGTRSFFSEPSKSSNTPILHDPANHVG